MKKRTVAILIYDDVEVLDFAGPYEVFAVTSELNDHALFDVFTVAPALRRISAVNGLKVVPDYTLEHAPPPDIIVVPGGAGSQLMMDYQPLLNWVRRTHEQAEILLSVCSGARILAKAGLLKGLRVTTHRDVIEHLQTLEPGAEVVGGARFVDSGKIITTAGISAGIDGSFYVVETLLGEAAARKTATYMEYDAAF